MYSKRTGLVLGFHGCDEEIRDKVVSGKTSLLESKNNYDWLGNGIYFWEHNIERAKDFAEDNHKGSKSSKGNIKKPSILGAIIDLGYCLDLLESNSLKVLKLSYLFLQETIGHEFELPKNKPPQNRQELLIRELDCAVIETLHQINRDKKEKPYDTVRGVFFEGEELYKGAGFRAKNHIQICIRNPNCIKGYFIPRDIDNNWDLP